MTVFKRLERYSTIIAGKKFIEYQELQAEDLDQAVSVYEEMEEISDVNLNEILSVQSAMDVSQKFKVGRDFLPQGISLDVPELSQSQNINACDISIDAKSTT